MKKMHILCKKNALTRKMLVILVYSATKTLFEIYVISTPLSSEEYSGQKKLYVAVIAFCGLCIF